MSQLLSIETASKEWGISSTTIRRRMAKYIFTFKSNGRHARGIKYFIKREDLEKFLPKNESRMVP